MFEKFGLSADTKLIDFSKEKSVAEQLPDIVPAKTVPAVVTPEGAIISDSLAIAEELASRHPNSGHWPSDPKLRATARTLSAEMHSGFGPLRTDCPMNLRTAYSGVQPSEDVIEDLARLDVIWAHARSLHKETGPWLFGSYTVVDAFFAPIAARIAGYGLDVSDTAKDYIEAHLADPAFRRWRAMGQAKGETLAWYAKPYSVVDWPGPKSIPAKTVASGPAENQNCPYSGESANSFAEIGGRVFGFCNALCRDKTVADPEAWPAFMAIYQT